MYSNIQYIETYLMTFKWGTVVCGSGKIEKKKKVGTVSNFVYFVFSSSVPILKS